MMTFAHTVHFQFPCWRFLLQYILVTGNFGGRSNFPYTNSTTNGIYEMNVGRVEDMRGDN